MNFSTGEVISALLAISAILTTLLNTRKIRADVRQSDASAVNQYAEAATKMADAASDCQDKVVKMGLRVDELSALISDRDKKIKALEESIVELTKQVKLKDARIAELERMTQVQESEITTLRAEVEALRRKRER